MTLMIVRTLATFIDIFLLLSGTVFIAKEKNRKASTGISVFLAIILLNNILIWVR